MHIKVTTRTKEWSLGARKSLVSGANFSRTFFFLTKEISLALVNDYVSEGLGIMHLTPDRFSARVTYWEISIVFSLTAC